MRSPEGKDRQSTGCYLEVVEKRRLVWTDAFGPSYRPSVKPFVTTTIVLQPKGTSARYTAIVMHADEASQQRHEERGFHDEVGTALDQLVVVAKPM